MTKVLVSNIAKKNNWKIIANTHFDTADEKYRQHLRQYSRSIANTIGSNTNAAILTTLIWSEGYVDLHWKKKENELLITESVSLVINTGRLVQFEHIEH